ncbi:MAG: OstA family protein [Sphingobium sp.]|nr:OstA family protein [Sphingobium sp.]MBP6111964.1 OstA family protein [Sphingobium sp.]MBP8671050.1 OstA family protein [Sphingobium sp.]MBP9158743.1 OstA family protein [Sphingobium sp.]MCC6481105.1 OstA family protein [Sphingomonadaceae bacterium]
MRKTSPILASLSLALGGAALAGYGLAGAGAAQAQLTRGHDSDAPVDFSADRIEVQDRADRVVVSGNVHVTQAGLVLDAARMTVAYRNVNGVEIQRLDASGDVRVTRGTDRAHGDVAIYDLNSRIITMLGNVHLYQGSNHLTGGRLVMDLNSGRSTVDGQAAASGINPRGGRVSGTFTVPERQESGQK